VLTTRDVHRLAELDQRIRDALADVRRARVALAHSTNADSIRVHDEAQSALDGLLERRFALQPRRPSWRS